MATWSYDANPVTNWAILEDHEERIDALEAGVSIPDFDPSADPSWAASVGENRLTPFVSIYNFTTKRGAGWAITVGDPIEPTDFTPGIYDDSQALPDYVTEEQWRFWQTDDVDGPTLLRSTSTGEEFIYLLANDSLPPTRPAISISDDGSYTITESTDSGIGMDRYDIHDDAIQQAILVDVAVPTGPAGSIDLTPGVPRNFYVRAYDLSGNGINSELFVISGEAPTEGTVSVTAQPASVVEGNPSVLSFSITGRTDATDVSVTFATVDVVDEFVDGTHYYGRGLKTPSAVTRINATTGSIVLVDHGVNVGEYITVIGASPSGYNGVVLTVSGGDADNLRYTFAGADPVTTPASGATVETGTILFPSGDQNDVTVNILTEDVDDILNGGFEAYIKLGSASGAAKIDESTFEAYSTLCVVTGTGTGSGNYGEVTTGSGKGFSLNTDLDMTLNSGTGEDLYVPGSPTGNEVGGAPSGVVAHDTVTADYRTDPIWNITAPSMEWLIDVTTTGEYTIWGRGEWETNSYWTVRPSIDGERTFGDQTYNYMNWNNFAENTPGWAKFFVGTASLMAGNTYAFRVYPRHQGTEVFINGFILTTDLSYTPNDWDLAASIASSTSAEDNPLFPTGPTGGNPPENPENPPTGVITDTDLFTLFPVHSADGLSVGTQPTIILTGIASLQVTSATATSNGSAISVSDSVSADGLTATFVPSVDLLNNATIIMTVTCTAVDTDGVRKSLEFGATGSTVIWTFDVAASGAEIFDHDFEAESLGTYTNSNLAAYWNTSTNNPAFLGGTCEVINDPKGTHGKVLEVFFEEGVNVYNRPNCCSGTQWLTSHQKYDELYLSYDVMFESGFDFDLGGKLPGLIGETTGEIIAGGKDPTGYNGWSGRLMFKENGGLSAYVYHATKTSPDWGDTYYWPGFTFTPNTWVTLEVRYIMNDYLASNGIIQGWVDGTKVLDTGPRFQFTNTSALAINGLLITTYFGGGWPSPQDQHVYWDNFVISTGPITH